MNRHHVMQQDAELRCHDCGKLLQASICPKCHGEGRTRHFFLFERTCAICDGSGELYSCPDAVAHWHRRLAATMPRYQVPSRSPSKSAMSRYQVPSRSQPNTYEEDMKALRKNPFLPYYDPNYRKYRK
jgi:hypothetical protein